MRFAAARNVAKAWLLLIGVCAVLALVGWSIGGVRLLSIFVFAGLLLVGGAYWTFDRVVLGMVRARELPLAEAPLLHSTVERLAARAGVLKPKLYLIPDGLPLALATGRGPTYSAIALSSGCLGACPPAELEGVIAHELAHVKHRDVALQTAVVVLAASIDRAEPRRRLSLARAALRARPRRCRVRARPALAEAGVRGGPPCGGAVRVAARPRRRAPAARAGRRARRVPGVAGDGAAVDVQPVHRGRARRRSSSRIRRSAERVRRLRASTPEVRTEAA